MQQRKNVWELERGLIKELKHDSESCTVYYRRVQKKEKRSQSLWHLAHHSSNQNMW